MVSQVAGTALGVAIAVLGSGLVYGLLRQLIGIRLDEEAEYLGPDLAIHHVSAYPEEEIQKI